MSQAEKRTSPSTGWRIHIKTDDTSEISHAIESLHEQLKKACDNQTLITSRLVFCEELLIKYAENGYPDASIQLRRIFGLYSIRIIVPGAKLQVPESEEQNNPAHSEDEVRKSIHTLILKNGNAFSEYSYSRNTNIIDISLSGSDEAIGDRILELYEKESDQLQKHPFLLLWRIAGMNPVLSICAVLNRFIKRGSFMLMPICTAAIIDALVSGESFFSPVIITNLLFSVVLLMINCLCNYRLDLFFYKKRIREMEYGIKSALLKKMQTLNIYWLSNMPSGGIFSKIIRDTEGVRQMVASCLDAAIQVSTDVVILLIATAKCPAMLLFFVLTVPIATYLIVHYKKPIRASSETLRKSNEHASAVIRDMQFMWQMTRLHGVNHTEYNLLDHQLQNTKRAGNDYDRIAQKFNTSSFFTFQFFQLVCLAVAVYLATKNIISVGMVVMFRSYFDSLINSVTKAIESLPNFSQGAESLRSLNEVLCSNDLEPDGTKVFTQPIRGEIEFKDVTFQYPDNDKPVIRHLSFVIPSGKSVAIIGSSGSGKTTLLNLITGLLPCGDGQILIDGVPIDEIKKDSFRHQIAVVPQNTTLFSGTLWENLVYGQSFSTYDEVMEVLEKIGMKEFVESLPGGLDSEVKEYGANFSGGQKQRISIARALLRKPRLLLFDEATSALDNETEQQVQQAINAMMGQCIMIIIAHRLTTIRNCNLIFRLNSDHGIDIYNNYDEMMKANVQNG